MHPRINKTTDNGTEFACHEMIAKSIGTKVYFADPYSSWQKGNIENVNGLIRQYIPKNTCFSNISQQQITKIMQKINTRPRENSISQLLMSAFMTHTCQASPCVHTCLCQGHCRLRALRWNLSRYVP